MASAIDITGMQGRGTTFRRAMALARGGAILVASLLLVACVGNVHLSFLDAQGPVAAEQRWHFYWVGALLVVLVAAPIFVALPLFLWRYRLGNKASKYTPKWNYSRFLEIASWGGPIVIVGVLSYFVWHDSHRLDPYRPLASIQPELPVQVIGYDWKWLIIYPDQGIATIGTMAMPTGRPLAIQVTSATVMQSFFAPSLGSQIYAMGGMVTRLHLEASRPGRFLSENTMYSGDGFDKEKFTAVAMTPEAFTRWVAKVRSIGVPLDDRILKAIARRETLAQLIEVLPPGASRGGVVYLTDVTPKLFLAVVRATKDGAANTVAQRSAAVAVARRAAGKAVAPIAEKDR